MIQFHPNAKMNLYKTDDYEAGIHYIFAETMRGAIDAWRLAQEKLHRGWIESGEWAPIAEEDIPDPPSEPDSIKCIAREDEIIVDIGEIVHETEEG